MQFQLSSEDGGVKTQSHLSGDTDDNTCCARDKTQGKLCTKQSVRLVYKPIGQSIYTIALTMCRLLTHTMYGGTGTFGASFYLWNRIVSLRSVLHSRTRLYS